MAKHNLRLEIPTVTNDCILRIIDVSTYSSLNDVACPILSVTLPGFVLPVQFSEDFISTGFTVNLTACDLEVQTEECGTTFNALPDGIYVIKYSVSPNEYVFVEYNHLRMAKILARYDAILCDLDAGACAPSSELEAKLKELHMIKMYLEIARATVEVCHNPQRGMEMFSYAKKLLDKFSCTTCQSAY